VGSGQWAVSESPRLFAAWRFLCAFAWSFAPLRGPSRLCDYFASLRETSRLCVNGQPPTSYLCFMQEGKRQKQIGGLLFEELSHIFQKLGLTMLDGGMVSISSVKVTPDLLEARIYLSLFQVKDQAATLKKIHDRAWEIKKELAAKVGKQLRRMPVLQFYQDDTLEHVFKMEEIFKKINPKN
jgi:ribosome-binding factor A